MFIRRLLSYLDALVWTKDAVELLWPQQGCFSLPVTRYRVCMWERRLIHMQKEILDFVFLETGSYVVQTGFELHDLELLVLKPSTPNR